jgi:hypothetical protein
VKLVLQERQVLRVQLVLLVKEFFQVFYHLMLVLQHQLDGYFVMELQ